MAWAELAAQLATVVGILVAVIAAVPAWRQLREDRELQREMFAREARMKYYEFIINNPPIATRPSDLEDPITRTKYFSLLSYTFEMLELYINNVGDQRFLVYFFSHDILAHLLLMKDIPEDDWDFIIPATVGEILLATVKPFHEQSSNEAAADHQTFFLARQELLRAGLAGWESKVDHFFEDADRLWLNQFSMYGSSKSEVLASGLDAQFDKELGSEAGALSEKERMVLTAYLHARADYELQLGLARVFASLTEKLEALAGTDEKPEFRDA